MSSGEDEVPDGFDWDEYESEFDDGHDAVGDDGATGDLEDDEGTGDHGARRHPAVFASNWRTVLAVDAGMGVVLLLVGVVLAIAWNPIVGGFIGSVGFVYVALVVRRGQDWARQRREAGLDQD